MKKILIAIATISLISCEPNNPAPQTEEDNCNDYCKCGEVVYLEPDGNDLKYHIKNNCTGEINYITKFADGTYYGDVICLDECW